MPKRIPTLQLENFNDMLDFPTADGPPRAEAADGRQVIDLALSVLEPFPGHAEKFPLYTGLRLEDMVDSVRRHGVETPILVWITEDGRYVVISGHNRINASQNAGLATIPALLRQGLSEAEAEELFYELNLRQRGLADMTHAQRAMCIAGHYSLMKRQGTRTDLLAELDDLINPHETEENETSSGFRTKLRTDEKLSDEYGLSREKVAQYCRLATLYQPLLSLLDHPETASRVSVEAGYHLSFVESPDLQEYIHALLTEQGYKLDIRKAELLKAQYQARRLDEALAEEILSGAKARRPAQKKTAHKVKPAILKRFFTPQQTTQEIDDTIEKALELYFAKKGDEQPNE